jgi:hypothetical protein
MKQKNVYLGLLFAVLLSLSVTYSFGAYTGFISDHKLYGDSEIIRSITHKINDPDLLTNDVFFEVVNDYYPKGFIHLNALAVSIFGDAVGWNILFIMLFILFISGIYSLTLNRTQSILASIFAALMSSLPVFALGTNRFGISIQDALPRSYFLAITPWIILTYIKLRKKEWYWNFFLALFVGIISNFHSISGIFLMAPLLLTHLVTWKEFKKPVLTGIGFSIGILPSVISQFGSGSRVNILEFISFRLAGVLFADVPLFIVGIIIPLILFLLWYKHKKDEFLKNFAVIVVGFSYFSHLIFITLGNLLEIQILRMSTLIFIPLFIGAGGYLNDLVMTKNLMKRGIAVFILIFLLIMPLQYPALRIFPELKNSSYADQYYSFDPKWHPAESKHELYSFAEFAQSTPKDSLFVMPPISAAYFRAFSDRSVTVSSKDGSTLLLGSPREVIESWVYNLEKLDSAYASGNFEELENYAIERDADYIVLINEELSDSAVFSTEHIQVIPV